MTLATSSPDGDPWNAPVWVAFDEAYHCFWVSAKATRYSQNIRANPRVALVVYDSTGAPSTGKVVSIQARAEESTNEQDAAYALAQRTWMARPSSGCTGPGGITARSLSSSPREVLDHYEGRALICDPLAPPGGVPCS